VIAHWALVAAATALFAASAGVYRYYNMQYEMRELFVVLGVAAWLTTLADRRQAGAAASGARARGGS
jgi:NAD(P)H-dependent FMN reductase